LLCLFLLLQLTERPSFQESLPDPPKKLANMGTVKQRLKKLMDSLNSDEQFTRLAYQCASTFRATDYSGGCNGARIRFPPGSDWPINAGLNDTIALLTPIKEKFGTGLSYSDLIVLAGNLAAERAGSPTLKFCPGRTDDNTGTAWERISYGNTHPPATVEEMLELVHRRGQTYSDFVALTFLRFRTAESLRAALDGANDRTSTCNTTGDDLTILALQYHPEVRYWADNFASSPTKEYATAFAQSWTRLMNADRFDGPVRNKCG
jgi:catalase-peroxidase